LYKAIKTAIVGNDDSQMFYTDEAFLFF